MILNLRNSQEIRKSLRNSQEIPKKFSGNPLEILWKSFRNSREILTKFGYPFITPSFIPSFSALWPYIMSSTFILLSAINHLPILKIYLVPIPRFCKRFLRMEHLQDWGSWDFLEKMIDVVYRTILLFEFSTNINVPRLWCQPDWFYILFIDI